jgi:hypothetical protein
VFEHFVLHSRSFEHIGQSDREETSLRRNCSGNLDLLSVVALLDLMSTSNAFYLFHMTLSFLNFELYPTVKLNQSILASTIVKLWL